MDILYAVLFVCVLVAGRGFIPWRLVAGWHLAGYWTRCGWAWLCETNAWFREQEREAALRNATKPRHPCARGGQPDDLFGPEVEELSNAGRARLTETEISTRYTLGVPLGHPEWVTRPIAPDDNLDAVQAELWPEGWAAVIEATWRDPS